jgi:hypothetical protein
VRAGDRASLVTLAPAPASERARMLAGAPYNARDPELLALAFGNPCRVQRAL